MLQSIDPKHQTQVANLLKWLAFAEQPLTVHELAEIFTIYPDQEVPFDEDNRFFEPDDVLKYLPGLVITTSLSYLDYDSVDDWEELDNEDDEDEEDNVSDEYGNAKSETRKRYIATWPIQSFKVQLVHFSVKEYLVSQRIACGRSAKFSTSDLDGHLHISKSCLAYHLHISHTNVANADTVRRFPLWKYAAAYWLNHMESAGRQNWHADASKRLLTALLPGSKSYSNLILIRIRLLQMYWTISDEDMMTPLGFVCDSVRALPHVLQTLIESGVDVNETSFQETTCTPALYFAVDNEHETISRILLENGADVNATGGEFGHALQAAARRGNRDTVELLLAHGADVNATGGEFGHALQAAANSDNKAIAELLLAHGADVNAEGGNHGHALQAAANSDNKAIAELLLAHGADVNAEGGNHGHALQAAADSGNKAIIELLLAHGADVNAKGGDYGHALQAAARRGNKAIIELLLAHGADVNAEGGNYGHALQAAAYCGSKATVELLLAHGADVNATGGEYGHALQAAAYYSNKATVELLLAHGADVNAEGGKYGNALQAAIATDKLGMIALLVSKGVTLDPPGEQWDAFLENLPGELYWQCREADKLRKCQENPKAYFEARGITYPGGGTQKTLGVQAENLAHC